MSRRRPRQPPLAREEADGPSSARFGPPAGKNSARGPDLRLVLQARNGNEAALDALIRRYTGFVRLKASSYFLAGGEGDDLIQEGLIGLCKAVRDFRSDKDTSFRSFAELCITRQIITAIKTATRFKHSPLNSYVSFGQAPAGGRRGSARSAICPGPASTTLPSVSSRRRSSRASSSVLGPASPLESDALAYYIEGNSYEEMAELLGCDTKTIDNALQRVKRKILMHQQGRQVLDD